MILTAAFVLFYVWVFYGLFLIYCTVRRMKQSGKMTAAPPYVRWMLYLYLALGVALDFVFNCTLGAVMFLEAPWGHGVLFTARCHSHRADSGWRKNVADWVCDGWLNPAEDGHC
jgi:hypothetical protein